MQLAEERIWPDITRKLRQLRQGYLCARECYGVASPQANEARIGLEEALGEWLPGAGDQEAISQYLEQLRKDMIAIREEKPGYALDAWTLYFDEHNRLGRSLTKLNEFSSDEKVRFFARVVHGTNGHAYWTGGAEFKRNHGGVQQPRRWWWEHHFEVELPQKTVAWADCSEKACINPEHCVVGKAGNQYRHDRKDLLGRLQVWALRTGKPPSKRQWERKGGSPTVATYSYQFGSWENALLEAGLAPYRPFTAEECIAAVRFVRHELGHWPTYDEFLAHKNLLKERGFPSSVWSLSRHFGTYSGARERAKFGHAKMERQ